MTDAEVVDCLSSSDHNMITWKIHWECDKKSMEKESNNYARVMKAALLGEIAFMD